MTSLHYPQWLVPTENLGLPGESVHIWQVWLDVPVGSFHNLAYTLSPDEKQRAERFRFERDRHRYMAGRRALRAILGRYLKTDPAELRFCYGTSGKPALEHLSGKPDLEFNLAHSQNLMLCAVAQNTVVGIDLEYLRPITDLPQLTRRFFAEQEHLAIQSLPADQQLLSFFQHWTCKEALLKAVGEGLVDLSKVEVLIGDRHIEIVKGVMNAQLTGQWKLHLFCPAPDFVAAIATNICALTPPSDLPDAAPVTEQPFVFWQYSGF
ncbi:4'-phosphopantetheinyl transferase superfamily protein [Leptothermofonsia sichuanensis E412]|uniref:4'-phosphopantetheinyl transferase family protein n=1 Tax=Leptothermofonsia sichuanensis TaxID=2917832 RepID=UPI001CA676CA|nr:4'-phosphopantetheinyl transferase superfamily protein [Leptothermofonsia sichuanensis]QZZ20822.1 4'-phosphopantetheinyl transferase superfamily protein [Leptothermofonsia sichuanensis E412]